MTGQQAILKCLTKHKEGRTLDHIYKQYQATTKSPILCSSVLVAIIKLIDKGCAKRVSEGHYRATGKPYYSDKGKKKPESVYITAIRAKGGAGVSSAKILKYIEKEVHKCNLRLKPGQKKRAKPALLSALAYLSLLKSQGKVTQDAEGNFGLPETADPEGEALI